MSAALAPAPATPRGARLQSLPLASLREPIARLLAPMIASLGALRDPDVIASAVPADGAPLTPPRFAELCRRLGFEVALGPRAVERWTDGGDGALLTVTHDGAATCHLRHAGDVSRVTEGQDAPFALQRSQPEIERLAAAAASCIHVRQPRMLPLKDAHEDAGRVLRSAYLLSLAINVLALVVPLLTMVVYDRVIGGAALDILPGLAVGGALGLASLFWLRRHRAKLLAAVYARFGGELQAMLIGRLLRVPLVAADKLHATALLARVKESWRVVDRLSNNASTAVFDAPFIVVSLLVVALVGGWIVIVPALYLALFLGLAVILTRVGKRRADNAGRAIADREALLAELAEHAVELRVSGLGPVWLRRFAETSHYAARATLQHASWGAFTQSVAYALGTGAALATLVVGVSSVLTGAMTAGSLIATMMLVWRITVPAQAVFFGLERLRQGEESRRRLESTLTIPVDASLPGRLQPVPATPPSLHFDRVSFRYPGAGETALLGVTLTIKPGEIVAVMGPTGSGKTTLLRLAAGLLSPQAGVILVDGHNLDQLDPDAYRMKTVGYVPAHPHSFGGTLDDNLAVAAPLSDEAVRCDVVRATWPSLAAPDSVVDLGRFVPDPSSGHLRSADDERLGIARLLAKRPQIALLDTPVSGVGEGGSEALRRLLDFYRGRTSVLFSISDPTLAQLADKVVLLNAGAAVYIGPPKPAAPTTQEAIHADP